MNIYPHNTQSSVELVETLSGLPNDSFMLELRQILDVFNPDMLSIDPQAWNEPSLRDHIKQVTMEEIRTWGTKELEDNKQVLHDRLKPLTAMIDKIQSADIPKMESNDVLLRNNALVVMKVLLGTPIDVPDDIKDQITPGDADEIQEKMVPMLMMLRNRFGTFRRFPLVFRDIVDNMEVDRASLTKLEAYLPNFNLDNRTVSREFYATLNPGVVVELSRLNAADPVDINYSKKTNRVTSSRPKLPKITQELSFRNIVDNMFHTRFNANPTQTIMEVVVHDGLDLPVLFNRVIFAIKHYTKQVADLKLVIDQLTSGPDYRSVVNDVQLTISIIRTALKEHLVLVNTIQRVYTVRNNLYHTVVNTNVDKFLSNSE